MRHNVRNYLYSPMSIFLSYWMIDEVVLGRWASQAEALMLLIHITRIHMYSLIRFNLESSGFTFNIFLNFLFIYIFDITKLKANTECMHYFLLISALRVGKSFTKTFIGDFRPFLTSMR